MAVAGGVGKWENEINKPTQNDNFGVDVGETIDWNNPDPTQPNNLRTQYFLIF